MKARLVLLAAVTVAILSTVDSLRYQDFEEGSCLQHTPQPSFNETWFAAVPHTYVTAGNRYQIYRMTSSYSRMSLLGETEFLSDSCLQANITQREGILSGFGGGLMAPFNILLTNQKGVVDFVPVLTPGMEHVSRLTVTLTDNKSFVFFANCWSGSNQRGWNVVSLTPTLDASTQQLIEDHAVSLGFDKKQFLFLRQDRCGSASGSGEPGKVGKDEGTSLDASWQARNQQGGRYSKRYLYV